ncbi:hypothetical protein SCHPADRAFT_858154 [Schizopora paradoxa]|uniref:MYND-type domain-containing protein n=1 Tax=Schizopora paradoxa TaxID=27342 RepID=A0A0H2RWH8_9AGAM|nr:hypothetical protein SCHPADRAFT_858154 [Schizopora paradoxa]
MPSPRCKVCGKSPEEGSKIMRCPCKTVNYCGVECQRLDWKEHKRTCKALATKKAEMVNGASGSTSVPTVVKAVDLTGGFNMPFHPIDVEISSNHEMFRGAGILSPLSRLIGQPILIYRHLRDDAHKYINHPERQNYDNQAVTHMMIDPSTGYAAPRWQCGIGRVTIARQDKSPLTTLDLEKIWMYCDSVLDSFSDGHRPSLQSHNPAAFEEFAKKYDEEKKEYEGFDFSRGE